MSDTRPRLVRKDGTVGRPPVWTGAPSLSLRCDWVGSAQRARAWDTYARTHVLADDGFLCPHYSSCKASHLAKYAGRTDRAGWFFEGQLHHVGDAYDLRVGEHPLRIVVTGQEYGNGPARVDRAQRSHDVAIGSGREHRFVSADGFASRNPHMRGTTSVLRLLFGLPLGADYEGEFIDVGRRAHLFDAFALVNFLLCSAIEGAPSAVSGGSKAGLSTRTMQERCAVHFRAALAILEPTVVVVQGKSVGEWCRRGGVFDTVTPLTPALDRATLDGQTILVAKFTHPSAHFPHNWGANESTPYLLSTVVPTVRAVRQQLGIDVRW